MVDRPLVLRKIERIQTYLDTIRQKKDPGIDAFQMDRDLQSIILFNLIQAIQACSDIAAHIISDAGWEVPGSQAEAFETLAEKKVISAQLSRILIQMAGFRNRIVHEYEKTDLKIVHRVWKKSIKDLATYCGAVVRKFKL